MLLIPPHTLAILGDQFSESCNLCIDPVSVSFLCLTATLASRLLSPLQPLQWVLAICGTHQIGEAESDI
ncbi:hypothetical protein VNO77_43781 [Canavalia gladiata]|uniref:Uncharacterized protein n=1 Tax=Canavalia gladiata TaxID=3824 RepID=A0AAN9PPR3_CANGL